MEQHEMFLDSVRHVAKLCAVAAMTAPKSGGQLFLKGGTPFIETVIVEDKGTLKQLADWLRAQDAAPRSASHTTGSTRRGSTDSLAPRRAPITAGRGGA